MKKTKPEDYLMAFAAALFLVLALCCGLKSHAQGLRIPPGWEQTAHFLGETETGYDTRRPSAAIRTESVLPETFDWRTQFADAELPPIQDQGMCGCCW